ncbi:MAG: hypothetical protein ACJ8AE_04625, partial [Gemmatimonadaceae bacterium]
TSTAKALTVCSGCCGWGAQQIVLGPVGSPQPTIATKQARAIAAGIGDPAPSIIVILGCAYFMVGW